RAASALAVQAGTAARSAGGGKRFESFHGKAQTASRVWLAMQALSTPDHAPNSEAAASPCCAASAAVQAATAAARRLSSSQRSGDGAVASAAVKACSAAERLRCPREWGAPEYTKRPWAARSSRAASAKPARGAGSSRGRCLSSRQACASASKCPARLPLSTAETYRGASGRRVAVSYQLKRWPRWWSNEATVARVASKRSTRSRVPSQPKSLAATTASRERPMLVGEVRPAT